MTDKAARAIADIMRDRTSMPLPQLLAELRRRHLPVTPDEFEESWLDEDLQLLARVELMEPELVINLPALLAGRSFTHQLSADEVAHDLLLTAPDFTALWPLLDISPYDRLDGHPIEDDFDEESLQAVIRLDPGTLAGYEAGSFVCISVAADGLHLTPASEPDAAELSRLVSVLVEDYLEVFGADLIADGEQVDDEDEEELLADTPAPRGPVALEEFMALVLARHETIFTTPGTPIARLLPPLGLDHEHGTVAVAGFDFEADNEEQRAAEEIEMLIETYDLDQAQAVVVLAFSAEIDDLHRAIHDSSDDEGSDDGDGDPILPDARVEGLVPLLPALAEPMVVVAIAEENLSGDPHLSMILMMILEALEAEVPRRARAGFTWLEARCADLVGDAPAAEAAYERALDLDSDHFPSMRELASIASLRGDAAKAVSLLLRAGVPPQDPEFIMVSQFAGESRSDVGRNEDCWCGSGRKYKKCHLGKSDHDLESRSKWLYHKASHWIRSSFGRDLLVELAATRAHPDTTPAVLIAAVNDPLVMDVALFEGDLLGQFLDERGPLLPADERELAESWLNSRRSLFRVLGASRDTGLQLEDLVTGETIRVSAPAAKVKVGRLLCLRLLVTGTTISISGGVQPVEDAEQEVTLAMLALQDDGEVDPERVISVLTRGSADTAG